MAADGSTYPAKAQSRRAEAFAALAEIDAQASAAHAALGYSTASWAPRSFEGLRSNIASAIAAATAHKARFSGDDR